MFEFREQCEYPAFVCPHCGGKEHTVWKRTHPFAILYILIPIFSINEILLGQRHPSRLYSCKRCTKWYEWPIAYLFCCPSCSVYHDSRIWYGKNAFGNWLGLICPDCGGRIPSLLNLFSWLILICLSPLRWLLLKRFGKRYQAYEQQRAIQAREKLRHGSTLQRFEVPNSQVDPDSRFDDPAFLADLYADRLRFIVSWPEVLAMALRDGATSVQYQLSWIDPDSGDSLSYVTDGIRYGLAPPDRESGREMMASARRLAAPGLIDRMLAWIAGSAMGRVQMVSNSGESEWRVVVWGRKEFGGVEFTRLSPLPAKIPHAESDTEIDR
jgi:hypothetical protein